MTGATNCGRCARIQQLLELGTRGRHEKTANFRQGLLDEYDARWTFWEVESIDIPLTWSGSAPARSRNPMPRR